MILLHNYNRIYILQDIYRLNENINTENTHGCAFFIHDLVEVELKVVLEQVRHQTSNQSDLNATDNIFTIFTSPRLPLSLQNLTWTYCSYTNCFEIWFILNFVILHPALNLNSISGTKLEFRKQKP